jgi:hypothetical protein
MTQHRGLRLTNNIDSYCKTLIREMESHGWTGRYTTNSHILMRAPDGETTCSIAPRVGAEHRRHNIGREFRAWLRQQEAPAPVIQEPEQPVRQPEPFVPEPPLPVEQPVDTVDDATSDLPARPVCDVCGRDFAGQQPLSVHKVRAHVRVACEICDRPMSPGNLPRHLRGHEAEMGDHAQVMRKLWLARQEIDRLNDENLVLHGLAEEAEARAAQIAQGIRDLIDR